MAGAYAEGGLGTSCRGMPACRPRVDGASAWDWRFHVPLLTVEETLALALAHHLQDRLDPCAQSRSTITGAWSLAPLPARSSRSMKAPVTRAAKDGLPRTKSMRMPRLRSKRCR